MSRSTSSKPARWGVALLFAGLVGLLLVPMPEFPGDFYLLGIIQNSAHGPAFACLTWALLSLPEAGGTKAHIQVFCLLALFAVATEVAQHFTHRHFSLADIGSNLLGIGSGFLFSWLRVERVKSSILLRSLTFLGAGIILVLMLAPLVVGVSTWHDRSIRFPVLFEPAMAEVLTMTQSLGRQDEVDISLQPDRIVVELLAGPRPGLVISDFVPDWRGYEELVIEVGKFDGGDLLLELFVRDKPSAPEGSDWFFAHARIDGDGWHVLSFALADIRNGPQTRQTQLAQISAIAMHRRAGTTQQFAIRKIYLR